MKWRRPGAPGAVPSVVRGEVTCRAVRSSYTWSSMTTKPMAFGSSNASAARAPSCRGPNSSLKASL